MHVEITSHTRKGSFYLEIENFIFSTFFLRMISRYWFYIGFFGHTNLLKKKTSKNDGWHDFGRLEHLKKNQIIKKCFFFWKNGRHFVIFLWKKFLLVRAIATLTLNNLHFFQKFQKAEIMSTKIYWCFFEKFLWPKKNQSKNQKKIIFFSKLMYENKVKENV